ncbi:MAG: type II secretion system protein GspK [Chromatiaceae bacterium]
MAGPHRRARFRTPGYGCRRGIALVLVLWVLTLLTVMAVGMTAAQRTETALTENQIADARFRALADAAIAFAMFSFLMPAPDSVLTASGDGIGDAGPWIPNGAPRPWRFAGEGVSIAVSNERSRINLNQASPELLAALMAAFEVPDDEARSLADAIADWRDEDDLHLLNGAEDDDYEAAGRTLGAKDAPFTAVEELQQVLGVSPALYRLLAPELSVDSDGNQIDQSFASPAALAALQGIPLAEAELQVEERDNPIVPDAQGPRAVNRGGPLYRIRVNAEGLSGKGRGMEALVELTAGQQPPYQVRWRRYGLAGAEPVQGSDEMHRDGAD